MYLARLFFIAGEINVIGAERSVRGHDEADGRIDAREFFDDDGVIDVAESGAAELFGKDGAQKTEPAGVFDGFEREDLLFVPFEDVRRDFGLGKFAHSFA